MYLLYDWEDTRGQGYIGCVCVYIHVIQVIRLRHQVCIGGVCVYVRVIGLTRERDQHYIDVFVSMYRL